ncbi:MAG: riboflavin synthase [Thermoplasmataceae archaeon]
MKIIGVADTTFARFNMGASVISELNQIGTGFRILRYTVPGIKDLPVASAVLFSRGCDIVVACGMPGSKPVDKISAQVASMGLMWVQVNQGKHIIEVFVHEDEAADSRELAWLCDSRSREHARNAYLLLFDPEKLTEDAGQGLRQGFKDVGPVDGSSKGGLRH